MPALLPAILDGGFCFGPLDPVSNIIANAVRHLPAEESSAVASHGGQCESTAEEMARRSVQALVGFMICYFRYLPTLEAIHYLCAAKGDLLAAVVLVEAERCTRGAFNIHSCTTKTALRCAAGAAGHADLDSLARAMLLLSSRSQEIVHLLESSADHRLSSSAVEHLRRFLLEEKPNDEICTEQLMLFANSGLPPVLAGAVATFDALSPLGVTIKDDRTNERTTKSLHNVLLDKIHAFYLTALTLLPQDQLRRRYHRSLVMAGHCYGPLDPVSNILLNTIWYDAAFPVPKDHRQPELDMVGRSALIRAERCSIDGLVAGLRAFAGDYKLFELALLQRREHTLMLSEFELAAFLGNQQPSESELYSFMAIVAHRLELYRLMAIVAEHPSDNGLQEFLTSDRARVMLTLPRESRRFSAENVRYVIRSLSQDPPPSLGMPLELACLRPVAENVISLFPEASKSFYADMGSFRMRVKVALDEYVLQNGGPDYVMHVICGANESVADRGGPEYSKLNWPRSHNKLHYSHINFLASPAGSCTSMLPTLFFAECVNHNEPSDHLRKNTCCPVVMPPTNAENVRCFYCEYKGVRIIHPADGNYHGCDTDFEKLACKQHILTNDIEDIFNNGNVVTNSTRVVQEDFVYFDYAREPSCCLDG
uniref:Uncharacterized protein n=1 Tax=Leersia perrieri TaxID=77586 RepID=A0A0D9XIV3_9ORYZ